VNIYDPADGVVYVHLARENPSPTPLGKDAGCARLPAGYANGSPSTSLRHPRAKRPRRALVSPPEPSLPIPEDPGEPSLRSSPERRHGAARRVDTV
jgi:hypothetical protein